MRRQRNNERGAVAVLAGIVLIVVGGFLALSLNVGHKMLARAQLQVAIDNAAMAGARALNGCTASALSSACCPGCSPQPYGGVAGGRTTAQSFASKTTIDGVPVSISTTNDVTPGWWDGTTFHPPGDTVTIGDAAITLEVTPVGPGQPATPQFFNAMKVTGGVDGVGSHNARLPVFFGGFVGGPTSMATTATAIAVGGGPCDENVRVLPMVVRACALVNATGSTICDQTTPLTLNFDDTRNIAFADIVGQGSVDVLEGEVRTELNAALNSSSATTNAGFQYAISDGGPYDPVATIGILQGMACAGATPPLYSGCKSYVVPVVNDGFSTCENGTPLNSTDGQNNRMTIVGFTYMVIRSVTWTNTVGGHSINVHLACQMVRSSETGHCPPFGLATGPTNGNSNPNQNWTTQLVQ
jgi:hypothetical protein